MENSFNLKKSVKNENFSSIGLDFYNFFKNNNFNNPINHIDKTLLILEVLKNNHIAISINRPIRFGKTFNLNMLACFFHPEQDEGKRKNIEKIFKQLNIYNEAIPDIKAIFDLISLALEKEDVKAYIEIAQKEKIILSKEIENILKNGEQKKIFNEDQKQEILNEVQNQYFKPFLADLKGFFNIDFEKIESDLIIHKLVDFIFNNDSDQEDQKIKKKEIRKYFQNKKLDVFSINFQQSPVILFSFKDFAITDNDKTDSISRKEEKIRGKIAPFISRLYKNHSYILNTLNEHKKERFQSYMNEEASYIDLSFSLQFLSEVMREFFGKKVYILIDDIDTPFIKNYGNENFDNIKYLFNSMIGIAIKDNSDNLDRGIFTGMTRLAKSAFSSSLNNIIEYTIFDETFKEYFGFTKNEVENLIKILVDDHEIEKVIHLIKNWYDGYKIGGLDIYNPWSISNCLYKQKFQSYWVQTESSHILNDILFKKNIHDEIFELFANQTIHEFILEALDYEDLKNMKDKSSVLFSYLLFAGYLTIKKKTRDYNYIVKVPNREILNNFFSVYFKSYFKKNDILFPDTLLNLEIENDPRSNKIDIEKFINSYKKKHEETDETIFHNLFNAIYLISGLNTHVLTTEVNSDYGKTNSLFYPIDTVKNNIIIKEFKYTKNINKINSELLSSLWLIIEKNYMEKFIDLTKLNLNFKLQSIVFYHEAATNQIQIEFSQILEYNMEETKFFVDYFNMEKTKNILDIKNKDRNIDKTRKNLLKEEKVRDFDELLTKIKNTKVLINSGLDTSVKRNEKQPIKRKAVEDLIGKDGEQLKKSKVIKKNQNLLIRKEKKK